MATYFSLSPPLITLLSSPFWLGVRAAISAIIFGETPRLSTWAVEILNGGGLGLIRTNITQFSIPARMAAG
ncbi:hypothetical protein ACC734_20295 [Rhizobium ruizarguesonis]|uniref:hypothetical protein n=1 Tax=Rhizobium brockwellii TaxID=3019932 RepID=UPI003F96913A